MKHVYDANNLPFWSERDLEIRDHLVRSMAEEVRRTLSSRNRAWSVERIESPMLIPRDLLSEEYSDSKMFVQQTRVTSLRADFLADWPSLDESLRNRVLDIERADEASRREIRATVESSSPEDAENWPDIIDHAVRNWAAIRRVPLRELVLRPETTPATYEWMRQEIVASSRSMPYCCWQLNKSFRREQDQPTRHMRLKEFWQQEFQCAYSSDTFDDYQALLVPSVKRIVEENTRCPARVVVADRLPKYSVATFDVEVWNSEKWMEICSISKRIDFPEVRLPSKKDKEPPTILVAEVATSPDRQTYCLERWRMAWESVPEAELMDHDISTALIPNDTAASLRRDRLACRKAVS